MDAAKKQKMTDKYDRKIDYLRLSITDRCNLRCTYCMPEAGVKAKAHDCILTLEEILTFAGAAAEVGLSRIRLTGGEPLVRKGIVGLVADLTAIPGIEDVSMTTNGILLEKYAKDLYASGLRRVNISIDSLDPAVYHQLTRWGSLATALAGMRAAIDVGMAPVKINTVVLKGLNDDFEPFAKLIYEYPVHVRFIEYMPAFYEKNKDKFVSGEELEAKVRAFGDVMDAESPGGTGPARYFRLRGAKGSFGIIGSSKGHFCASCNRVRLTADGKLRTCLFSDREIDVLKILRRNNDPEEVKAIIKQAIKEKPKDRFEKREGKIGRSMSQIGG